MRGRIAVEALETLGEVAPKKRHVLYWARKLVQLSSFIILNGAIFGVAQTWIALPVLLSLGAPQKTMVAALDALQQMLASSLVPWIPIAVFIIFAIFVGRSTCGWICPFGFLVDLTTELNRKRADVSPRTHTSLLRVKYVVLALVLLVSGSLGLTLMAGYGQEYMDALGVAAKGPFSVLSPESTATAIAPLLLRRIFLYLIGVPPTADPLSWESIWQALSSMSWLLAVRLTILVAVLAMSFKVMRSWCRYLCPAGALLGVFSRYSFLGLRRNLTLCNRCGDCNAVCPMKIRITEKPWEKMTDPECIMCLECVEACTLDAIRPTVP